MSKFKKGDRVRTVAGHHYIPVGSVGTVQEDYDPCPHVKWDNNKYNTNGRECYALSHTYLELVKEDTMVFGTKVIDPDGHLAPQHPER